VVDRWLNEKRSMDYAVEHLADANFDPEFYKRHEADIVAFYNKKYWKELKPAKKDWRRILGKL
jgi:NADH oxidase (H2O2-forming)